MSENKVIELYDEIKPDEAGCGWIDCSTATNYSDDNQYERILASIKQNIEQQQTIKKLELEKEQLQKESMQLMLKLEAADAKYNELGASTSLFMVDLCDYLMHLKNIELPVRIGSYIFEWIDEHIAYKYEPVQEIEPIEVKINIIENETETAELCPLCKKELGQYPAISRSDNKTKICSNCGTLEALLIWKNSLDDANKDI